METVSLQRIPPNLRLSLVQLHSNSNTRLCRLDVFSLSRGNYHYLDQVGRHLVVLLYRWIHQQHVCRY